MRSKLAALTVVPNETLPRVVEALSAELRRRTSEIVELPAGERVDYETVTGEPWQAFNDYRGDLASPRAGEPGHVTHNRGRRHYRGARGVSGAPHRASLQGAGPQ